MQTVPETIRAEALQKWDSGESIATILRLLHSLNPVSITPVDLMFMCVEVFGGTYETYRIIGGWWVNGTPEIDDAMLEERLAPRILEIVPSQERLVRRKD
jgi:hypothetical protein